MTLSAFRHPKQPVYYTARGEGGQGFEGWPRRAAGKGGAAEAGAFSREG